MTHVVLVADAINRSGLVLLEQAGMEVVESAGDAALFAATLPRAHALLVRSATQVTARVLGDAPNLKLVGRAGAGIDNVDVKAATLRGIAVVNAPGANTVSAAEHAFALLLSLLRHIPDASLSMRDGKWDRGRFGGAELRGKTLGIAGFGRVGSHVATIGRAFGMSVLVYDPFISEERATLERVELVRLDDLLRDSDVVTLHMPLTKETACMIDRDRLRTMKSTAVLVNTARGGLVDEEALVDAVRTGVIGGAALDVFSEEPLAEDSPLRNCPGILVTPHLGASTAEAQERVAVEICESTRDALLYGDIHRAVNISGVSGESLGRLQPLLALVSRVGRLAAGIAMGPVKAVEVSYHGSDDDAPKPAMLAALEGILGAMGVGPVSLINSLALAEKRGIAVERRVGKATRGFATAVGVTVTTGSGAVTVVGALVGDREGRIVEVDGFPVDFAPGGNVVVLRNEDIPGVIGQVGLILGDAGINIGSYHQARRGDGKGALAAIVVDHEPDAEVLVRLGEIAAVLEVRHVAFGE